MPAHEGADAATPPVLKTSNNWRTQFHTEVSCALDGPRRVDNPRLAVRPGKCTKEQEKPRALQIAHCHDPAEKGGVSSFGRTSASTWSPCPNGVQNTRIQCSQVDNDWSPLHTITGEWLSSLLPRCARNQRRKHLRGSTVFPWLIARGPTRPTRPVHAKKNMRSGTPTKRCHPGRRTATTWRCLEGFELTEGEQNWHEKIALLSFALQDVVHFSHLVLPNATGKLAVELQDKKENFVAPAGVPQTRHH